MGFDILLAVAAALVAIYGVARDIKRREKIILIGLAVVIAGASIAKAWIDERDKDLTKTAIVGTLDPTHSKITAIYNLLKSEATSNSKYDDIDYMKIDDGMVFYLKKNEHTVEIIVLDRIDVAELYSLFIMEDIASWLEKEIFDYIPILGYGNDKHKIVARLLNQHFPKDAFDETGFSEDVYGRLCILAQTSIRQILRHHGYDCDFDDKLGLTATFENDGRVKTVKLDAKKIKDRFLPESTDTRAKFAETDEELRKQVTDRLAEKL